MSMLDALDYANRMQQQRIAAEDARTARQRDALAMQQARDALLAAQMADAAAPASPPPIVPTSPIPASPIPASPIPASPIPASPIPASPIPASPIPIPDSAHLYDSRARAQAHVPARAGIDPHSRSTPVANANES